MKRIWAVILMVLFGAASVFSQAAKPTPPDDNEVVKISTNLIQIDVSVTDAKGKAITDLKPGEVEVYENGEKQKITNFSFISSVKTTTDTPKVIDKTAVPVPPVALRPEN